MKRLPLSWTAAGLACLLWACGDWAAAQTDAAGVLAAGLFGRKNQESPGPLRERLAERRQERAGKEAETQEIAGLPVSIWHPASDHVGPAPLVIFSHGFHSFSTQSTFLMKALADNGYLVIAPNHRDSSQRLGSGFTGRPDVGFGKPDQWSDATYRDRADGIVALVKALQADAQWSGAIDWTRVALAGHSLGGYTVLGLAGAWPSWKLPIVKAVLALSPYSNPYLQSGHLGTLGVPVMYQGGTRDFRITPFVKKAGGAYDLTSAPAYFVEFDGAGHFAWTDLNPDFHASIVTYSLAFLNKYVKGDGAADPTRKLANVADLRSK